MYGKRALCCSEDVFALCHAHMYICFAELCASVLLRRGGAMSYIVGREWFGPSGHQWWVAYVHELTCLRVTNNQQPVKNFPDALSLCKALKPLFLSVPM